MRSIPACAHVASMWLHRYELQEKAKPPNGGFLLFRSDFGQSSIDAFRRVVNIVLTVSR